MKYKIYISINVSNINYYKWILSFYKVIFPDILFHIHSI